MTNALDDDYEIGFSESPNAEILNQLFKNAQVGKRKKGGLCTVDLGNDTKVSFPSKVCHGLIDVKSFKCDPKTDSNCEL